MRPELTFRGDFETQPKTSLAPGAWYLGFRCQRCGAGVAILDDPTGTGELTLLGDARLQVSCPACSTLALYTPTQMRTFQSPVGGVTAPGEAV
ncbi:MAG TPA: hypothetical protein VND97_04020 [Beijerinckiaceae bacterium]|nr:hypothetical protein [Beijerinckiaceae bacterium]